MRNPHWLVRLLADFYRAAALSIVAGLLLAVPVGVWAPWWLAFLWGVLSGVGSCYVVLWLLHPAAAKEVRRYHRTYRSDITRRARSGERLP